MNKSLALCMILICLPLPVWALADSPPRLVGEAFSMSSGELLYREFHSFSQDRLDHHVSYRTADDKPLAEKVIDYRFGESSPAFTQTSFDNRSLVAINWDNSDLVMRYQAGAKPEKNYRVKTRQPLVIDAGFNNFVRKNWQRLLAGESVKLYYAAANRDQLLKLRIKISDCFYPGATDVCFSINSANALLRLLVPDIELGYNQQTRQLSRFRGAGNILDKEGKALKVDIHYEYPLSNTK